jgi:hypothetical protein
MNRAEFMCKVYRIMSHPDAQKVEKAYLLAKNFTRVRCAKNWVQMANHSDISNICAERH